MLGKPHVQVFIEREARRTIAAGQMRASHRLLELIDDKSGAVSFDATKHVLGIAGIRPPDTSHGVHVNVGVSVGYVIDNTEPRAPDIRTVITQQDQGS
jgi:hypothetical protein